MTYNKPDTKAYEYIYISENIIPSDICDRVIKELENREWQPHTWYNYALDERNSYENKELDVQLPGTNPFVQDTLINFTLKAGGQYCRKYHFPFADQPEQMFTQVSQMRFNRYSPGQIMRQHHDHIHALFDGKLKGVPVLSFILNLNDDYEGGDLFFWEDRVVKLGKGDIVIFPSNFLFPHGVTKVTKGKRYSAVCWGW